jgi:hypothetical protein
MERRDHHLPLDPAAFRAARQSKGRVIVIAPTRAACETIELALGTHVDTLLERKHGHLLRDWARRRLPFGIVAGTGTGKTLGIRPIAEEILGESLTYGVVNREREATPETPSWNVVVVTTGIARHWFQGDVITPADTLVVDEIHQTSAELELCLALGKRTGCRFIWLSATVDPTFYAGYLGSAEVLETSAFDPALRARVEVLKLDTTEFFDDKRVRHFIKDRRGVAVFVPTRAEVEKVAGELGARWPKLNAAFYHGGEPIRVIRPFLEGSVEKPFVLAMTAAGQSALNVPGLDTVIIYDARYGNVVDRGRNVLHRMYLGANEILQMAGRVHGRVKNGEVTILSDRQLDFASLKPGPPEFQLAGDAERVALTCAALGVDATELDLPVALDRTAYRRSMELLTERGLIKDGRLTEYGRQVDAMPVERQWGELLAHADIELTPMVAVCASIESLHRMTREERDLHGVQSPGSDHLTIYNLYAEAVNQQGSLGSVYGLGRHVFDEGIDEWAERRGVLVKAIEDGALGVASIYRALEQPLPGKLPYASKEIRRQWGDLIARIMPFDLVIDEETSDGREARISKTSVAGNWGAVAGSLRYFADRFGVPRASIEGTTLSYDLIRDHAAWSAPEIQVTGDGRRQGLAIMRRLRYFGFELEADVEPISGEVPPELVESARDALTMAVYRDSTRHSDQGVVTRAVEMLDEWWRRSGGLLEAASPAAVKALIRAQLAEAISWSQFLHVRLAIDPSRVVSAEERGKLERLPGMVRVAGDAVAIEYALERGRPVARLVLREGQARRLRPSEIPALDRPLRFVVHRGEGPAVEGDTIEELIKRLDALPRRTGRRPEGRPGRHSGGRHRRR